MQKEEENESYSHHEAHKFHNPTSHHMANSTELPGHHNLYTMMSNVKHQVSDILLQPHENEEEARRRYDEPETPSDEKISMTRTMFKSIMAKALEEQKVLADETSTQVAKVAFTEGVKQGSQRQAHPNHSSSVETESARPTQGSVMTNNDFELQQIHQIPSQ